MKCSYKRNAESQLRAMASLKLLLPLLLFVLSTAAQPSPAPLAPYQPLPPPPPPLPSVIDAVETLANSGYMAMSFTLQFIAPSLPFFSAAVTPLTVFSPPDASFNSSGQPSLAHLLLHFSPVSLSPAALLSFPFSTPIPSLSPYRHLIVTSNHPHNISINNVAVSGVPILDDGVVVVYAIDDFFDLNFTLNNLPTTRYTPKPNSFQCTKSEALSRFGEAAAVLKSRGRSIIASFLELQLLGFLEDREEDEWTIFAPSDEEVVGFSGEFLEYSSLFTRHLVPCKVAWFDLEENESSTAAFFNLKGFALNITKDRDGEMLMVNGIEITFPEMYDSGRLVVHGIKGVIPLPELDEEEEEELIEE